MLFKSLHKDIVEEDTGKEVSEEQLHKELEKKTRKYNRKQKLKNICIVIILGLGIFGGYKSLMEVDSSQEQVEAENQTFVKTYASNYFMYPNENSTKYLEKFTLDNTWRCEFENELEFSKISDIEVYKVKLDKKKNEVSSYYMYGDLTTKKENEDQVTNTIYFRIDVAKQGSSFLVVKPLINTGVSIASIKDEDVKNEYKFKGDSTNQTLDESEQENLKETLELFIKTWNDNPVQARLLTSNKKIVEDLDSNIKLTLETLNSSSQDDDTIYAEAKIVESYLNVYSSTRTYYFEIDRDKQKIKKMEVY